MKILLGLGTAGSNVVNQLAEHKQYKVYTVTPENEKTTKYKFSMPALSHPEEYENMDMRKLDKFLSTITKECSVFLCGASVSTAVMLRALEPLHRKGVKINVVYFMPEVEVLSETKALFEHAVRNILQEYARSAVFEKITLVSNTVLEEIAGSTNVYEYFNQINQVFTSTYYMIDVFKNSKPITSTFTRPRETCRISTIGLGSLEKDDLLFFPFNEESEVVYYFGINEEKLRSEGNLLRTITDKVKERIASGTRVSFGIYPTKYEDDYVYVEYFSSKIQKITVDTE